MRVERMSIAGLVLLCAAGCMHMQRLDDPSLYSRYGIWELGAPPARCVQAAESSLKDMGFDPRVEKGAATSIVTDRALIKTFTEPVIHASYHGYSGSKDPVTGRAYKSGLQRDLGNEMYNRTTGQSGSKAVGGGMKHLYEAVYRLSVSGAPAGCEVRLKDMELYHNGVRAGSETAAFILGNFKKLEDGIRAKLGGSPPSQSER